MNRSRLLSKRGSGNTMFLETPEEQSTVPPVCRLGHLGLNTLTCCIRPSRGADQTECSCLQKNVLDCVMQPNHHGHLHTGEAKHPGIAHSARLVLKARKIPREPLLFRMLWKVKEAGFWCQLRIAAAAVG